MKEKYTIQIILNFELRERDLRHFKQVIHLLRRTAVIQSPSIVRLGFDVTTTENDFQK